jgi:hypothetical protein
MEVDGVLFDVSFKWNEVLVDESGDFVVAVRLGFQPSTCASSGSRAEVDEHRLFLSLGLRECSVSVCQPVYFHVLLLFSCFAVEMFLVLDCLAFGFVNCPVAMFGRRVECVQFQLICVGNIDHVVSRSGGNYNRGTVG